jgi:predicted transcriptional regulator
LQRRTRLRQQGAKALLPLVERLQANRFAVEVEQVEQEKDERPGVARVGRGLDQAERGRAVGTDAAELAIEIGLPGVKR